MLLGSSDIEEGGNISSEFTCDGADLSPHLMWSEAPNGTASLQLRVVDPDAPNGSFLHWAVDGIDPSVRSVRQGADAEGQALLNDFGEESWGGPCPPEGEVHRYIFTISAIDAMDEVLAKGAFIAKYER
jgi:Raf kinase inhibitor-like YbhB/YbcL family protein